jgi:hypothetical protein
VIVALGGFQFGLISVGLVGLLILLLLFLGKTPSFKRIRFGFFLERTAHEVNPEEQAPRSELDDAPPEVKAWLARFFEQYPPPWREKREDDDTEATPRSRGQ